MARWDIHLFTQPSETQAFVGSGRVIRVILQLRQTGCVLSKPPAAGIIRPRTRTAHYLLQQLNFLSNFLTSSYYLKYSAIFQKELEDLCSRLRSDIIKCNQLTGARSASTIFNRFNRRLRQNCSHHHRITRSSFQPVPHSMAALMGAVAAGLVLRDVASWLSIR